MIFCTENFRHVHHRAGASTTEPINARRFKGGGGKGGGAPDTSAQDEQLKLAREQLEITKGEKEKLERENQARRRNVKNRRSSRSLLLFGDERGVDNKANETLGGK
ncbi:MAG: hypothetical protein HOB79_21075 [Rhodospirillaceae bacterium]|jgi:hypothetical protein|nr:hypothetical protein [Rhodospirillaceae bacterium]MBT7486198.1 hypothetical protein [Rhodospirillales bacterium]MBT4703572.1 hypothetical protein [Rhodospirillaceae bacterium]MBT5036320.1 hypothetical protein [Rhodospirillaceae bacterium]MBT6218243.1 hypothetical protein [Rhodospirillaceae bacterium]